MPSATFGILGSHGKLRRHNRRLHLGWVDQAIYDPQEIKQGVYRLHTGLTTPGPHQGSTFSSNGVIPATRQESAKLMEVRAAHSFVKIRMLSHNDREATVSIANRYAFRTLKDSGRRHFAAHRRTSQSHCDQGSSGSSPGRLDRNHHAFGEPT